MNASNFLASTEPSKGHGFSNFTELGNKPVLCAGMLIFDWCRTGSEGTGKCGNTEFYIYPNAALPCPNRNPEKSPTKSATSSAVFCANTYYSQPTGLGFSTDPGALLIDEASVPELQMLCVLQSMQLQ